MQDFSRVVSTRAEGAIHLGGPGHAPPENSKSGRPETPFPAIFYVFCGILRLKITSAAGQNVHCWLLKRKESDIFVPVLNRVPNQQESWTHGVIIYWLLSSRPGFHSGTPPHGWQTTDPRGKPRPFFKEYPSPSASHVLFKTKTFHECFYLDKTSLFSHWVRMTNKTKTSTSPALYPFPPNISVRERLGRAPFLPSLPRPRVERDAAVSWRKCRSLNLFPPVRAAPGARPGGSAFQWTIWQELWLSTTIIAIGGETSRNKRRSYVWDCVKYGGPRTNQRNWAMACF